MSDTAIRVENLGKKYKLGSQKNGSFRESLAGFFKRNNQPPISNLQHHASGIEKDFWALKDINFEIKQGEAVGIIGRNGAGKSTLLKILSRITEPTKGRFEIFGRVSSLLEVGTGFHEELTGRENVYLNGTILGMRRAEVKAKFDEIIDFSGVEKFIDTPVKHYSSGMKVRLAFAVAAHLEPEILIIDEVLAVGDADFQKKCLGKMEDVTGQGRTVLFVSHNMGAVNKLCNKGIVITKGEVSHVGDIKGCIASYQRDTMGNNPLGTKDLEKITSKYDFTIDKINILDPETLEPKIVSSGDGILIRTYYTAKATLQEHNHIAYGLRIKDSDGILLFKLNTLPISGYKINFFYRKGVIDLILQNLPLTKGEYYVDIEVSIPNTKYIYHIEDAFLFNVEEKIVYNGGISLEAKRHGSLFVNHQWVHNELVQVS